MKRYDISPEGGGEINIEPEFDGDWMRYDDYKALEEQNKKLVDWCEDVVEQECLRAGDLTRIEEILKEAKQ